MFDQADITNEQHLETLTALRMVTDLENSLFPVGTSLLARRIIWELIRAHYQASPLSVKALTLAVGGSENGTRRHLQRLEQHGLLVIREGRSDRRVLELHPSEQLLAATSQFLRVARKAFKDEI